MAFAKLKLPIHFVRRGATPQTGGAAASGISGAREGARFRRADHGARRGDRALVRIQGRQRSRRRAGLHDKPDIKLMFKNAAHRRRAFDAADQLARPDQRAEGFRAHRRRPGRPHQLVRADLDDEPVGRAEIRHQASPRRHALLQHDQWRPGLRRRQGRQDRAHDADRSHRTRTARPGPSRPGAKNSRRRARRRWRRTARTQSPSSIRPIACSIR